MGQARRNEKNVMKKIAYAILGTLCALAGLLLIPSLLYNACGLAGLDPDCGGGSKWENAIATTIIAIFVTGAFYLAYRLFRSTTSSKGSI